MADRLNKIVTRGGDGGETSLGDGARVKKSDPRVSLLGDVDELNSWIGVVLSQQPAEAVRVALTGVQHDLFDLGGALSFPGAPLLSAAHVARIDEAAAALNQTLAPLKEFILPGGAPLLAWLHVARTVCRRVEREQRGFSKATQTENMRLPTSIACRTISSSPRAWKQNGWVLMRCCGVKSIVLGGDVDTAPSPKNAEGHFWPLPRDMLLA